MQRTIESRRSAPYTLMNTDSTNGPRGDVNHASEMQTRLTSTSPDSNGKAGDSTVRPFSHTDSDTGLESDMVLAAAALFVEALSVVEVKTTSTQQALRL